MPPLDVADNVLKYLGCRPGDVRFRRLPDRLDATLFPEVEGDGATVLELHLPLVPDPDAEPGGYQFTWLIELEEHLFALQDQDQLEILDDGEQADDECLYFLTGRPDPDLIATVSNPRTRHHDPVPKDKRYSAGRARALGLATRGTTAPNRLRRVDRWLTGVHGDVLTSAATPPTVVDLGFGASPVTSVELLARLRAVRSDVEVVGLEIDPDRVANAKADEQPGLSFRHGGFELAGLRPLVVRALNVLRQYDEAPALAAWDTLRAGLAPGGLLIEGTCDEVGRRAAWVALDAEGAKTLTFAAHLPTLGRPSALAERLPKALIHHNVPGEPVHALLAALDVAWERSAVYAAYGVRQRWVATCDALDWPVERSTAAQRRWRLGELTVSWTTVASPGAAAG